MISKILSETLVKNDSFFGKLKKVLQLFGFYTRLQRGIADGSIYHQLESQNIEISKLIKNFKEADIEFFNNYFDSFVKEFLTGIKLSNKLNFDDIFEHKQIGFNTIFVREPLRGLWTTGKAGFFLPTKQKKNCKIVVILRSIPPVNVFIEFNDKKIKNVKMPKLSTKKIEFFVDGIKNDYGVSKLLISTDKLWYPQFILKNNQNVTLGIGVQSIELIS